MGGSVDGLGYIGVDGNFSGASTVSQYEFENWCGDWNGGNVEGFGFVPAGNIVADTLAGSFDEEGGAFYCGYQLFQGNSYEWNFALHHLFATIKFKSNSDKARQMTSEFDGQHNGYGDAIRHCFWCALNKRDYPDKDYAEIFGNAHEQDPNQPLEEKEMDLHNNNVGYDLGIQAVINNWSDEQLYEECVRAAQTGRLQTYISIEI